MKYSEKSLLMIMKVIAHCKEHIQMGTRKRVWSTYFRYALGEIERDTLYSSKSLIENPDQDVIYEHSIPFNMIRDKLINLDEITLESVSGILEEFHVVAQISLKDDNFNSIVQENEDLRRQNEMLENRCKNLEYKFLELEKKL